MQRNTSSLFNLLHGECLALYVKCLFNGGCHGMIKSKVRSFPLSTGCLTEGHGLLVKKRVSEELPRVWEEGTCSPVLLLPSILIL